VAGHSTQGGDVTLLFTDIEDSTGLVRRLGDGYIDVLERYRGVVRAAIAGVNGREIDCRADELFAAFDNPADAVDAAVEVQQELAGSDVRVRMGIHTGRPTLVEGSYFGVDVHRAARICDAGHGGQILVSATTNGALDGPYEIRDLGEHELRGLPQPERILQLAVPGLPLDFPPLRVDRDSREDVAAGTQTERISVVLAEDSVLLREGIARLLEDGNFEVVGQAGTAEELLLKVRSYRPDVVIVDIRMPPTQTDEGLRAAKEIREKHPETAVLVLSQYVEAGYALDLLSESAEGVGYLLKDRVSDVDDFRAAVQRVAEGGSALDPTVVSQLVGRRRRDDPLADLTPREREVLELMAEGRSNNAIAEHMVVTERAVEKHVTSIFGKLGLAPAPEDHRRVLAVLAFLRG
jgi:DNA-binding NarL/FixJ family response regulator/class 3 adenylate cyclase